ncbi:hypothetical protein CCC_02366 [Paramagnetospirillum magnetotacticum MS-1]|uniref:Class I SAM-dependent methyltransferase n=1 Tax=Paramagnetospirillum magnetotacticum MS-1 TaxID=272627 RepID=A0A0C2V1F6_PARME|nr:class I SAM-dependent methyltransferase [Paramagnetospirillum magnetotacticum]KIL98916.1 hypothetical protein CCC_02366 [Paramagnetospirillum magnetotacticum MS-1]
MTAKIKIGNYGYTCQPRWGFGRPTHPRLTEIIGRGKAEYIRRIDQVLGLADHFAAIAQEAPEDSPEPRWMNPWFSAMDAIMLTGMLVRHDPRLLIEIGSGNSTKFARHAITAKRLRTKIVSIDPEPRAEVDALCDEVIRAPAEFVDPSVFSRLKSGDILFIDSSHRSLENSDVTTLFLEVLPELPPGVIVHVHDVYLPYDYPPAAEGLMYNEQYLLSALLLGEAKWLEPVFPNYAVVQDPHLSPKLAPLWQAIGTNAFPAPSTSFWLNIKKRR